MTQSAEMMLKLADEYEAGMKRCMATGYETYGVHFQTRQQLIIDALRYSAAMTNIVNTRASPPADGRLAEVLEPFAKAADNYADCKDERYIDDDAMVSVGNLRDARAALRTPLVSGEGKARKIPELRELLRKASRAISNQPFCGDLREFSELASAPDLIALFVVLASPSHDSIGAGEKK